MFLSFSNLKFTYFTSFYVIIRNLTCNYVKNWKKSPLYFVTIVINLNARKEKDNKVSLIESAKNCNKIRNLFKNTNISLDAGIFAYICINAPFLKYFKKRFTQKKLNTKNFLNAPLSHAYNAAVAVENFIFY